jgi:hypothetical protein
MTKRLVNVFIGLIVFSFLIGCDGPYKNCPEYYFSDTYKSYVIYNPGSYWVFSDTVNNKIDSMRLLSQTITFNDHCDYNSESEELLYQEFSTSVFNGNDTIVKIFGHASAQDYNSFWWAPAGYFSDYAAIVQQYTFLDSLKINDKWFKDVRVFKSGDHEAYWAKNIGLIKKSVKLKWSNDTIYHFEISRYHLE